MPEVIAELVGRLSFEVDDSAIKKFDDAADKASDSTEDLSTKGVALGTVLGNVATKAIELGVALVQHAAAGARDLVLEFAEGTKELDAWSKRIAIAPDQLQRLEFAHKSLGGEVEDVREGLQTWQENLGEFGRLGSGPAADALNSLGLRFEDLEGMAPEESLKVFADALQDLPNEAERVSVAMEVLGTEGSKLAPLLQQGAGGIQDLMDKADELGLVLDESAIKKGLETQEALLGIDQTTDRLKNTIAVALAPTVTDLADRFGDWYAANADLIEQDLPVVIDAIVEGVVELVHWGGELAHGLDNLSSLMGRFGDEGEEGTTAFVGLAQDQIEWSKAGIEAFVEWTDKLAEMAEMVWDVAGAVKDGLAVAYEDYLEPVIDSVTAAVNDQESTLGRVIDFVEDLVDRAIELKNLVGEIVDSIGLDRVGTSVRGEGSPVTQVREEARAEAAAMEEAQRVRDQMARDRKQEARGKIDATRDTRELRKLLKTTTDPELRETIERRLRGEGFRKKTRAAAGGGGGRGIDTSEADRVLGDEIRILGQGVGATDKAQRAALEAAAKSLDAGDSVSVARTAATSALGKSTGLDLSGASGPEAALFRELTQIGGVEAARSATDGAKFVNIDQSVTVTVGDIRLAIPDSFAQGLGSAEIAGGVEQALRRGLADLVFAPIVDAQAARSARP